MVHFQGVQARSKCTKMLSKSGVLMFNRMAPDEGFLFYSVLCLYNTVSVITNQSYITFFAAIYAKIGVIP
jgi:hypothetical protein